MTSLDPSHLPSSRAHRGDAVHRRPSTQSHPRPPAIPDLRFEQSYLLSIKSFIHSATPPLPASPPKQGDMKKQRHNDERLATGSLALVDSGVNVQSTYGAPITIDWSGLLWVTARDQVSFISFSPNAGKSYAYRANMSAGDQSTRPRRIMVS